MQDDNYYVRMQAAESLSSAYPHLPDEEQAWKELHKLAKDKCSYVRGSAAYSLGSAFPFISNKEQAWKDLIQLTEYEIIAVKEYANNSLGIISVFRASQAEKEKDFKDELETAISFFEKATHEFIWYSSSRFYLDFYCSFHNLTFKRQESKDEVNKYLERVKSAINDPKDKLFFEAVENLKNALKGVQNLENLDFEVMKGELNFCRKYFDCAAELTGMDRRSSIFLDYRCMRKELPILDRNLGQNLKEIQERAKIACAESKGTSAEEIACAINREIQKWELGVRQEIIWNILNVVPFVFG